MSNHMATGWRQLSGEKNWEGLLQPLDPNLRSYIIHYAQMAGAVGDLFDGKTKEPKASKQDFFSKACLVKGNPYKYEVTHFLYASAYCVESSWFGYVAVATDEGKLALGRRDIVIAWRGTSGIREWLEDIYITQTSASDIFPTAREHNAKVHHGFHDLYTGTRPDSTHNKTSVRKQVLDAVKELVNKYKDEELSITVAGFSLGAALATLTAMDIVANGYNKPTSGNQDKSVMVTTFTFGGPRIGNTGLARVFDELGDRLHLLRVVNNKDPIPYLPPDFTWFTEFGLKLFVNTYVSKYLQWNLLGKSAAFPEEYEVEDELNHDDEHEHEHKHKRTRRVLSSLDEDDDEYGPEHKLTRRALSTLDEDDDEYGPGHKRSRRVLSSLDEDDDEYGPERKRLRGFFPPFFTVSSHNMDVYAHGVAIKDIGENTPVNKLGYDIALVNKYLDRVENEYKIPTNWWVGRNRKKMVQLENGRWIVLES